MTRGNFGEWRALAITAACLALLSTAMAAGNDFADFKTDAGDGMPAAADAAAAGFWRRLYAGMNFRWPSWQQDKFEFFAAGFILLSIALHFAGAQYNRKKARQWWTLVHAYLQTQFYQVGTEPEQDERSSLLDQGCDEFLSYATGRTNISQVNVHLNLAPRHQPIMWFWETIARFLLDYTGKPDMVTVEIAPADGKGSERSKYDDFIFAIVNKAGMNKWRNDRYDLSLTRTSDHARLPPFLTVMSESAEITDTLLTPQVAQLLAHARSLQYLIITDQPVEAPSTAEAASKCHKRVVLTFRLPPSSRRAESVDLIRAAIDLVDRCVENGHFRTEVTRKLKNTRENEVSRLRRVEEDVRKEDLDKKRAAQRKAEKERIGTLSADEQRKALEKEREKSVRKQGRKVKMG